MLTKAIAGAALALALLAFGTNDNGDLENQVAALEQQVDAALNGLNQSTETAQSNDQTLAERVAELSTDVNQLQVLVVDQPTELVELVDDLNARLDELMVVLTGQPIGGAEELGVGGPSLMLAAPATTTTSTTTAPPVERSASTSQPPPTTSEATVVTAAEATTHTFRPEIEQWRSLATEALTWAGAPWAVDEMLQVIDNESDGCPTAAAYNGCPGVWLTRAQTGSTGCGARGLVQTCTLFWEDWATRSGLTECVPLQKSVDARCNLFVGSWLFVIEGCDWRPWAQTRPSWRRGHC